MVAVLLTGMSGAGKSTALVELARQGFDTVDTDEGDWIEIVDGEPLWRAERIDALLDRPRSVPLFLQGTVANQGAWYPCFGAVVLMTAPLDVLLDRLRTRTTNGFGKADHERERVVRDVAEVEPRLRRSATHVVDTTVSLSGVVDDLARIAADAVAAAAARSEQA